MRLHSRSIIPYRTAPLIFGALRHVTCASFNAHVQVLVEVPYLLGFFRFTHIQRTLRWPNIEISQVPPHRSLPAAIECQLTLCLFLLQIFDTWDDVNTSPDYIKEMRT